MECSLSHSSNKSGRNGLVGDNVRINATLSSSARHPSRLQSSRPYRGTSLLCSSFSFNKRGDLTGLFSIVFWESRLKAVVDPTSDTSVAACNFPEIIGRKRRSDSTSSQTAFVYFLNLQPRTRVSGGVLTFSQKQENVEAFFYSLLCPSPPLTPSDASPHSR